MNGIFIIPTGVGAEIGGHAGDSNPAVKLVAAGCDKLIVNPNAVNSSDINEMPENTLYVEGSILDRFLEGKIELKEVNQNKILLVVNGKVREDTINAVSTARVTIGCDIQILELNTPLRMIAKMKDGKATGDVLGWKELISQVSRYEFDALAIQTVIEVDREVALHYMRNGGVNPWGGVEAKASKLIADGINKPVAHAPLESAYPDDTELLEMLYEIRQLNQIVFLVAPSFFRLDEAIAVELSDALFHVHKTGNGRRGWRMFNRKKKDKLYYIAKKGKKSYNLVPSMFNGRFPDDYVVEGEGYREKKFNSLHKTPDVTSVSKTEAKYKSQRDKMVSFVYSQENNYRGTQKKIKELGLPLSLSTIHEIISRNPV